MSKWIPLRTTDPKLLGLTENPRDRILLAIDGKMHVLRRRDVKRGRIWVELVDEVSTKEDDHDSTL